MFDAVRTIQDILEYTETHKIDGRLIAIDFQKAFDSVSREYLFKTLSVFNFDPSFTLWVQTFYKNISSCVINNGYSTGLFEIQRGVRQGDPLSAYLFIICLEILAINIRSTNKIQGIKVGKDEIKMGLFAEDLTAFVRDDRSLINFVELVREFGKLSGLQVNFEESEIMLLGNRNSTSVDSNEILNISVKNAVKILGVHFSYGFRLRQTLNFDEIIKSVKGKLKIWKWRDLTTIGRIQIVKTFIVPIFMYRAGMISVGKEVISEVNKLIFDFIWKGKDKVKRLTLINDIKDGGLKAPHLESMIKSQRIMCSKKFASSELSSWKTLLSYYLKPVGGKFILCCNFDLKKLLVKLLKFCEECLSCFMQCSVANKATGNIQLSQNELSEVVIWNNKFICVDGKSVYNYKLKSKGIITLSDLKCESNEQAIWLNFRQLGISPLEAFQLTALSDALPAEYRQALRSIQHVESKPFDLNSCIQLCLNENKVLLSKAMSIYRAML